MRLSFTSVRTALRSADSRQGEAPAELQFQWFQFISRMAVPMFGLLLAVAVGSGSAFAQSVDPVVSPRKPGGLRTSMFGVARPVHSAQMPSLVRARITKVHVTEGQQVRAGDVLISLDDQLPRAAVSVAQVAAGSTARLKAANVELKLVQNKFKRVQQAFDSQASAGFEVEAAQADLDQARATIQRAEEEIASATATLELRKAELDQYSIRAPFDGQIIQLHSKVGTTVDQTTPVVSIANLSELEAEMFLPLEKYGTVKVGSKMVFNAHAPVNGLLPGRVLSVSPVINAASRTFRTVVRFENTDRKLPAGFSVDLSSR